MQTCWCVFFSEGESFFAIFVAQKRTRDHGEKKCLGKRENAQKRGRHERRGESWREWRDLRHSFSEGKIEQEK